MQILHTEGYWALVLKDDMYLVRHLVCKAFLRRMAIHGCLCKVDKAPISKRNLIPVDDCILKMYLLLTGTK